MAKFIASHPLIKHKITLLRDKNTPTKEFRELVREITQLMCYEVARDLPLRDIEVETPITSTVSQVIDGEKLIFIPILRAGLGMTEGASSLIPSSRIGHIGLYRNEETLQPVEYYCKLPDGIENSDVIVLDPMLATGGSAVDAITRIKLRNPRSIKFMCIIAAPEGLEKMEKEHPDVQIFCAALDSHLNENGYIVPGLGDAGDRIFGTYTTR